VGDARREELGVDTNAHNRDLGRLRRFIGRAACWVAGWSVKSAKPVPANRTALAPLTPGFDPAQHQPYVDHLDAALENRKIRNIALMGRYGSGKSSVLEEFARQGKTKKRTLFLSLSTLGPGHEGETKTNQIEKELVKQLLYREKPSRLPQSRYRRIEGLTGQRAVVEAAVAMVAAGVALWLFGVFPSIPGMSDNHPWTVRIGAALVAGGAAVRVVAWVRLAVHNRFVV